MVRRLLMIVDDQREVLRFLSSAGAYPESDGPVERVDTHGAVVFLTGDRAFKLKRGVRYDYMDFSTLALRRAACEAEVRINRRTAPDLYLGTLAIVRRPDGSLAIGGPGEPVDWLVAMRRFDQDLLLDRMAGRGDLDASLMRAVAEAVADMHAAADARPDHGGARGMRWVVDGNTAAFDEDGAGVLSPGVIGEIHRLSHLAVDRTADLLNARQRDGHVRQCHGDLHLRNICVIGGRPVVFDAVEFNDEIACIDVLYDLAFLLMDLSVRRLDHLANVVLNGYLVVTDDLEGLSALPVFLSCRAAIRAKTSLSAARMETSAAEIARLGLRAREYLDAASAFIRPARPRLVAIGGASGTGKSTLAAGLAADLPPAPGAVVIRSDAIRKQLCGVAPTTRLGPEGYAPDVSDAVYRTMRERADRVVRAGQSAIVDAVFGRPDDRQAIQAVARAAAVPFDGIRLTAGARLLEDRVAQRTADPSDATVDVVRAQLSREPDAAGWATIDASGPPLQVRRAAASRLSVDLS